MDFQKNEKKSSIEFFLQIFQTNPFGILLCDSVPLCDAIRIPTPK
jgi:hypothetical protein